MDPGKQPPGCIPTAAAAGGDVIGSPTQAPHESAGVHTTAWPFSAARTGHRELTACGCHHEGQAANGFTLGQQLLDCFLVQRLPLYVCVFEFPRLDPASQPGLVCPASFLLAWA